MPTETLPLGFAAAALQEKAAHIRARLHLVFFRLAALTKFTICFSGIGQTLAPQSLRPRKRGAIAPQFRLSGSSLYRPVFFACGLIRVGGERTRPV